MRFKKPEAGDTRVKTWFAWLPVFMPCETRWLETVHVSQVYDYWNDRWCNADFVDPPKCQLSVNSGEIDT